MKTSMILLVAIFLNSTLLLAKPAILLTQYINPWFLVVAEAILVIGYLLNAWAKKFREACKLNLHDFRPFAFKSTDKKART